jgi:poly(ribitol-phosphate) beta-N-acetylglucosaminyltransferase
MTAPDGTSPPDVSVIVPVFNALPYLTECLTSLVGQSIRPDRMEIIAVDDGSTDGSGKELARFEQLHPGLFTIRTQANSGGPAAPCNRGLEVATGRYVYFVGADDYLAQDALQRLVAEADDVGSDVVAGKMVGVDGRYVHQAFYARTDHDVQLFTSDLPWSMSNAKLFRRELIERHALQFPEDLPVNSDQAFTLEACLHARRISVLADDSYYFARRRSDAGNITYRTSPQVNLACATAIMRRAADLIPPGPDRDAILGRHFAWEIFKVLSVNFYELDEADQRELCRGVAKLVDDFFTDSIRDGLTVRRRLPICLAAAGKLEVLLEVLREQSGQLILGMTSLVPYPEPGLVLDGDRAYVRHAGFRADYSVDDRCYEILGESVYNRLTDSLPVWRLGWGGNRGNLELDLVIRVAVTGLSVQGAGVRVCAVRSDEVVDLPSTTTLTRAQDGPATMVQAQVAVGPLLARGAGRWTVALCLDIAGRSYRLPVPGRDLIAPTIRWRRGRPVRLSTKASKKGRLQLVVTSLGRK